MTVKVTHKRFHLLQKKLNFYWCFNLKTNNFAGKLNTKTSIQLCSRSKRKYLSNFSSSFVSNEIWEFLWTTQSTWKWWENLETQSEASWQQSETGTAKLMAATRKLLLYLNSFSELTYVHWSERIRETKFCFYLLEVLYNGRMNLIRSQLITGCNWWTYNRRA